MCVLVPAYLVSYGPSVFLNLCDIALFLTAVGLWRASPLLLSSQALSSLVVEGAWNVDLLWRAATGRHLIGGTAYMWDASYPLWLRLLSAFHMWLPVVLLIAVLRVGYDRRALRLQCLLAAVVLIVSRVLTGPDENQNFVYRDPLFDRAWGPGMVHVATIWAGLFVVYLLTHRFLARFDRRHDSRRHIGATG